MKEFITDDFLLHSDTASCLYHDYAAKMPIYDYHCHLPPAQIAEDKRFDNITQLWLYGDHYKWRLMRANGIDERYCTGEASDWEKFERWAATVPYTVRNPLYQWTHLELKRYFGINKLLNSDTAREIYETVSEMLSTPDYSTRDLLRKMNVKLVCTTDDPVDTLEHHQKIADDNFDIKVLPTWRPDKGIMVEDVPAFNSWVEKLSAATNIDIKNYSSYLSALHKRHDFFHKIGCRISDHGIEKPYAEDCTEAEMVGIFDKIRTGSVPSEEEIVKFKSRMMIEFGRMDYQKGWAQQLHFSALRNNNSRCFKQLGPDTGFDSIGDFEIAKPLLKFLDTLDKTGNLPKTIIYNLNPRDNALIAAMVGSFQDGSIPGKMQFGSAWWFLDQKDGIEEQIRTLSNMGLLSRFIGMLTDSRSFLSFTRHEYFRRILCNMLGDDVEKGELPDEMELLGRMVENISFNNACGYFSIPLNQ